MTVDFDQRIHWEETDRRQRWAKMALTLALPLFGLDPEQFSSLSMKLLNIEREQTTRNLSDSGRASPSTGSESSGVSSLATFASVELTPISSRSETPTKALCTSQKVNITSVCLNNSEHKKELKACPVSKEKEISKKLFSSKLFA